MKEYKIEGNIDFYAELFKSLDNDEDNIDDNNLCLITSQPLIDKYVTLSCGHKFNYIPLYNDLVNHKTKFNALEGNRSQLRGNENRCPYCRNKQEVLLPCYEELGLKKVPGVNVEAKCINVNYASKFKSCEYLTPNPTFDPNCENPQEIGYLSNCKFLKCYSVYGSQIENNYGDDKYYCYKHKKVVVKQYKKAQQDKAIEEKLKEKEKAKKEKEEAKQKAKEEKQKAKEELKKMNIEEKSKNNKSKSKTNKNKNNQSINEIIDNIGEENVVIGPSIISNLCSEILKTGPNKGKQCGVSIYQDCLCKRHYNLKNK